MKAIKVNVKPNDLVLIILLWIMTSAVSLKAEVPNSETYPYLTRLLSTLVQSVIEANFPYNFNYHWNFSLIADEQSLQPIIVSSKDVAVKLEEDISFILAYDEISEDQKKQINDFKKKGLTELETYLGGKPCQWYSFEQFINLGRYGYKLWHQYYICSNGRRFHFEYGYAD